ncbi:MAG: sensor domain-containing diguanylate cyclase [Thermoanaerobaculia bacterium]|nr:sensor domain-containing diguanylate cyclase [Thermoanaerobaculia bacterium]
MTSDRQAGPSPRGGHHLRTVGSPDGAVGLLSKVAAIMAESGELEERLSRVGKSLREYFRAEAVEILRSSDRPRASPTLIDPKSAPVEALPLGGLESTTGPYDGTAWRQRIEREGELLGLINLRELGEPDRSRRDILEAVANQLAVAMAAQQRYQDLENHTVLVEILGQVSKVALSEDSLDDLLDRVVEFLAERLGVTIVSILLLNESKENFEFEVYSGSIEMEVPCGGNWPITVGVCGRAIRTGQSQLVLDVAQDPDYIPGHPDVCAEYIALIRHREEILGLLNLESDRSDLFTPQAMRVVDHIADQVAGAIHLSKVNHDLEAANQKLSRLSSVDGLTGLSNRRSFDESLAAAWGRSGRSRRWLTVILADLDCFKALNDTHGHQYADDSLRKVARVLMGLSRRSGDTVARYGGEEFALILEESSAAKGRAFAEEVRRRVEALAIPHHGSPIAPGLTISVGVAGMQPREGIAARVLVEAADKALYEAKRGGRNRVCEGRPKADS